MINKIFKNKKGFTLVEAIILIAIISFIATTIIFVVKPGEQLMKMRDNQRENHLDMILLAIEQKIYQEQDWDCDSLPEEFTIIGSGENEYDLYSCLYPDFLTNVLYDTKMGYFNNDQDYYSGYQIRQNPDNKIITLDAIESESRPIFSGEPGIYTWFDLDDMRNNLSGDYILMKNLNQNSSGYNQVAGPSANGGEGWLSIGDNNNRFKGIFNGNNKTISDLYINRVGTSYVGLFGYTDEANIKNINLFNVNITGGHNVGALVGYNYNSLIDNSNTSGNIYILPSSNTGGAHYVGGLIGYNRAIGSGKFANVSNSSSAVNILINFHCFDSVYEYNYNGSAYYWGGLWASIYTGGLIGLNITGSNGIANVSDSYATGDINFNSSFELDLDVEAYGETSSVWADAWAEIYLNLYFGGLVGYSQSNIFNSYATGDIDINVDNSNIYVYSTAYVYCDPEYSYDATAYSYAEFYSTVYSGGLVGRNLSNNISDSYATGDINFNMMDINTYYSSYAYSSCGNSNSYDGDYISISNNSGGLAGMNSGTGGNIINSYSIGSTFASYSHAHGLDYLGGLVGRNFSNVIDSYWDVETSNQSTSDGGEDRTTAQMINILNYTDPNFPDTGEGPTSPWDIIEEQDHSDEIWYINNYYPKLWFQK